MFRFIGFILASWAAYCVFTSDLFATMLHVGVWILVGLVVLGISALFATSGSGSSRGHHGGHGGHRDFRSTYANTYEHELRRQRRALTREHREAAFLAESEARHERWRREDAEEEERLNAALGRW